MTKLKVTSTSWAVVIDASIACKWHQSMGIRAASLGGCSAILRVNIFQLRNVLDK